MRKRVYGRKLSRKKDAKRALLTGLVRALAKKGSIETSAARAKALKSFVDKLVSRAQKNSLAARRLVLARLGGDKETTTLIFDKILPRVGKRTSGFTRLIKLGTRPGDRSKRVRVEWVAEKVKSGKKKAETKAESKKAKKKE